MSTATCVDCGDKYNNCRDDRDGMCERCTPSYEPLPWDIGLDPFEAADDIDRRWGS
jgi:hypothetical protein